MQLQDLFQRFREQYSEEYTQFLLVDFRPDPKLCPFCQTQTIRKLWLGDPHKKRGDSIWGKWYMWCESCFRGIYCPLGTYIVPKGEPYIKWGDDRALKQSLPLDLHLISPVSPDSQKKRHE